MRVQPLQMMCTETQAFEIIDAHDVRENLYQLYIFTCKSI